MSNHSAVLSRRASIVWVAIATLLLTFISPIALRTQRVEAAQILNRYIDMDSSVSAAQTTYNVSFQLPTGVTIGSFRVEFCNVDPLPGQSCATGLLESDNVPDLGSDAGTVVSLANFALADAPGDTTNNGDTCTSGSLVTDHTTNQDITYVDVACNATEATVVTETGPGTTTDEEYINFDLVNINNPSNTTSGTNNDTFYVRLYVFAGTPPTAYNQATPPLGVYEGGIAMSTANQITLTARVQERLSFTVGTTTDADNCGTISSGDTSVDLGVLDTASINRISASGSDLDVACAEVTTNASSGVNIYYIGDELKVTGATCSGSTDDDGGAASDTDQCINRDADVDAGSSTVTTAGDEQWGIGIPETPNGGTTTDNLSASAAYNEDTASEFSFTPNSGTLIGSSTTVVDQESLEIDMGATASITTPTGLYTTTLTFIATATF